MDKYIILFVIIIDIVLLFFTTFLKNRIISRIRWLYLLPALSISLMLFYVNWDKYLIGYYIGALLIVVCLAVKDVWKKNICISASVVCCMISYILCTVSPFYNSRNYVEEFEDVFYEMKQHYILTDTKEIDWDGLYEKFHPKFVEAYNNCDYIECFKLYNQFEHVFYDGHVSFSLGDSSLEAEAVTKIYGNDYGLSLLRLESGEYVAFNVEGTEGAYSIYQENQPYSLISELLVPNADLFRLQALNAGIHNGTVITSWDGMPIDEVCRKQDVFMILFADKQNEEYFCPVHAAGIGGDSIMVSFIDDYGVEKQVGLNKLGSYASRLNASLRKLTDGYDISNLTWVDDIDDATVLLRVKQMKYGGFNDDVSAHIEMKDKLRNSILKYNEQGKKNLIIDLRSNSGGSPLMILELASLFAPEGKNLLGYTSKINEKTGSYDKGPDGKYIRDEELYCYGEDLWKDGQIIVLVNAMTVSAGDLFTYLMSGFPNVTIMGITPSNSSAQAFNTEHIDDMTVHYSAIPILDVDGEILIDTRADHKGNVPIDVIIPTTQEYVKSLFAGGKDYIVEYAARYFDDNH